ncbi:hypothetical protein, partial [Muribaculum intestinale]|uniref:hypothetical protein n=1 Tax=Muribaculum intestinale TaxID=1796646 RepID=UPI001B30CAA7
LCISAIQLCLLKNYRTVVYNVTQNNKYPPSSPYCNIAESGQEEGFFLLKSDLLHLMSGL